MRCYHGLLRVYMLMKYYHGTRIQRIWKITIKCQKYLVLQRCHARIILIFSISTVNNNTWIIIFFILTIFSVTITLFVNFIIVA